jgi:hypothetical protein
LGTHPTSGTGGGSDPFCRCQNTAGNRTTSVELQPTKAIVHVALYFSDTVPIDLIIIPVGGVLLVDDMLCSGRPNTSIYRTPVPNC